jgi:hypothetical protein
LDYLQYIAQRLDIILARAVWWRNFDVE